MSAGPARAVPVIVTRPAREAAQWVTQLGQRGFCAEALPLIEIAPAAAPADVAALASVHREMDRYDACLFVSGNAVEYFFAGAAAATAPRPAPKPDLRYMAPGPGTVAALQAAGVPPAFIDAPAPEAGQFDSEALWDVVGGRDWHGRHVLIVRGQGAGYGVAPGRDWIAQKWQAAGARVDFLPVYERRAPQFDEAQRRRAREAGGDGSVWLFSSSEAIRNLVEALPDMVWRGARAIATHPRIEAAAREAGWGVVVASRPELADIEGALRSIESGDT